MGCGSGPVLVPMAAGWRRAWQRGKWARSGRSCPHYGRAASRLEARATIVRAGSLRTGGSQAGEGQDGFARVKSDSDPPRRTARTASAFTCPRYPLRFAPIAHAIGLPGIADAAQLLAPALPLVLLEPTPEAVPVPPEPPVAPVGPALPPSPPTASARVPVAVASPPLPPFPPTPPTDPVPPAPPSPPVAPVEEPVAVALPPLPPFPPLPASEPPSPPLPP